MIPTLTDPSADIREEIAQRSGTAELAHRLLSRQR